MFTKKRGFVRLVENYIPDRAFIEIDNNFPLDKGFKIDSSVKNCEIKSNVNIEQHFLQLSEFPPIAKCCVTSFIFELNYFEDEHPLIEYIDINENPEKKMILSNKNIIYNPSQDMSIEIKKPQEFVNLPMEAEILTPDGIFLKISKSSTNFIWTNDGLRCNFPSCLTHRIRFRIKINNHHSDWSNWLAFKSGSKRTLGRVQKK